MNPYNGPHAARSTRPASGAPRTPAYLPNDAARQYYTGPQHWSAGPPYQHQEWQHGQPSQPQTLSEANLAAYVAHYPTRDTRFAENCAREEGTRAFNQAMYYHVHPAGRDANPLDDDGQWRSQRTKAMDEFLRGDVTKTYGYPMASVTTPLERHTIPSPAKDPWIARGAVAEMGTAYADSMSAEERRKNTEDLGRRRMAGLERPSHSDRRTGYATDVEH